jgi:hypothetical protein
MATDVSDAAMRSILLMRNNPQLPQPRAVFGRITVYSDVIERNDHSEHACSVEVIYYEAMKSKAEKAKEFDMVLSAMLTTKPLSEEEISGARRKATQKEKQVGRSNQLRG